jgi:alpha-N-arabinofuranosidase
MRPEYYADVYRRYNTFAKDYSGKVLRVACGPSGDDYAWTQKLMETCTKQMNALSVHLYTLPTGDWKKSKGSSTDFGEAEYIKTLRQALYMDEILIRHSAIMDTYDPEKTVTLSVDEWGLWTDTLPGTNPGFLQQQNSLRDAILAALTLNIFHKHLDRVRMANIAQMINVLQSIILTDGEKMLLTPTYHAFRLYKVHQGATSLPVELRGPDYVLGAEKIPSVSACASRDAKGLVHLTLVNTRATESIELELRLQGSGATVASGEVLTAPAVNSINTYERPDTVKPRAFADYRQESSVLKVRLPAKSIVGLELKP